MRNTHIIFTVVGGYTYHICQNDEKGAFVSSSSSEVMLVDDAELAKKIAKQNSKGEIIYKVKDLCIK